MPGKRHGRRHIAGLHPWVVSGSLLPGLQCLVRPLAQFRRHDSGKAELGTLGAVFLLELLQFGLGVWLLAEPGEGDDPVLFGRDGFRVLSDHDLKVIECFLILSQTEVRHRPSQPGIEIVGLGLELLVRNLKGSLGAISGRLWFACPADRHVDEQLVAQVRLVLLEVVLELVLDTSDR